MGGADDSINPETGLREFNFEGDGSPSDPGFSELNEDLGSGSGGDDTLGGGDDGGGDDTLGGDGGGDEGSQGGLGSGGGAGGGDGRGNGGASGPDAGGGLGDFDIGFDITGGPGPRGEKDTLGGGGGTLGGAAGTLGDPGNKADPRAEGVEPDPAEPPGTVPNTAIGASPPARAAASRVDPAEGYQGDIAELIGNQPRTSLEYMTDVPESKKHDIPDEDWQDWIVAVGKLPNMTSAEMQAYQKIFAAEGGFKKDPESSAASGILQKTVDDTIDRGALKGVLYGTPPKALNPDQRAVVYQSYFDNAFPKIGGGGIFARIGHAPAAAALADTFWNLGGPDGATATQKAINTVYAGLAPEAGPIAVDGAFGSGSLRAFTDIVANSAITRKQLSDALREIRKDYKRGDKNEKGEFARIDYFQFQ